MMEPSKKMMSTWPLAPVFIESPTSTLIPSVACCQEVAPGFSTSTVPDTSESVLGGIVIGVVVGVGPGVGVVGGAPPPQAARGATSKSANSRIKVPMGMRDRFGSVNSPSSCGSLAKGAGSS